MANWDCSRKEGIRALLGDVRTHFVGYNTYNRRTTSGIHFCELQNYDLILGYDDSHKFYVAWSAMAHQIIDSNADKHSFSLHKRCIDIENLQKPLACFYQRIEGTKKSQYTALEYYEKIVLIHESYIDKFCECPLLYLMPNREDTGYKDNTVFQDVFSRKLLVSSEQSDGQWYSSKERKRYCCSRISRSQSFRARVLNAHNYQCAICGESIEDVLQAAHIIAAKDGGSDDTQNGVCLCANHHLMFDSHLFYIDHKTRKIYDIDPRLTDTIEEKYV